MNMSRSFAPYHLCVPLIKGFYFPISAIRVNYRDVEDENYPIDYDEITCPGTTSVPSRFIEKKNNDDIRISK